ncbi:MAG TPA: DEAD/DEAH box helicase [Actinocrinis sp.]|nr:DEAD/DEAH box helicase [Actinocrinis sp.]
MYVLHALFSEAGFWELWAEDGTLVSAPEPAPDAAAGAARGRSRARAKAAPAARHPFAVRPQELAGLLGSAGEEIRVLVERADPRGAVPMALPSGAAAPLPSSELAAVLPGPGALALRAAAATPALATAAAAKSTSAAASTTAKKITARVDPTAPPGRTRIPTARKSAPPAPKLRAWIIPTLVLQPVDGAALLAALDESDRLTVLGPDGGDLVLPLGASTRYARAVARFAEAVVRRGEVLPTLDVDDGDDEGEGIAAAPTDGYFACWRPKYSYETGAYRKLLQSAMPPVFRAQLLDAELTGRPSADVLDGAVYALVDAYVMEALAGPHGLHGEPLAPAGVRATGPGAVARDWLNALTSTSGNEIDTSAADPDAVRGLKELIEHWQASNLEPRTAGPVRICLRLVPPESTRPAAPETADWTVELLLQSSSDPSLVATAAEVWQRTGAARLLKAAGVDPRTELLAGLGRAARVFPALGPALGGSAPTEVRLTLDQAYDFLRHTAPALLASGFGVLLPAWWSAKRGEVRLRLATSEPGGQPGAVQSAADSRFGFEQLVQYEWQASIGDQRLTGAEFEALAQAKSGLVQLRGQWVEVDRAGIAAGLRALGGTPAGTARASDVLRTALFGLDDETHAPIEVDAAGWLGDLLGGAAEQQCAPISAPAGMTAQLRPYQERGVGWLAFMDRLGLGAVLADDMGLGKTVMMLALLSLAREQGTDAGPTLLVCPMSLAANWQRESARFAPKLTVHVHHGAERLTGEQFRQVAAESDLIVTTYALALRDQRLLAGVDWHRVVIDEAQAIKNAGTKQSRAVRSLTARHRIALTGTPVENRLADLWSVLEFANPGLLGSAERFRERFAKPIERYGDQAAADRLRRATGAFILRRVKTDTAIISDLPEKVEMKVVCNLTKEQASLYQATVDEMLREIELNEGIARRGLVLAMLTRLKQICNHPAHFLKDGSRMSGRSGKLARVEELCEEILEQGEKALLFTQYAEFGGLLQTHLAARFGREVAFLHGGVPKKARDAMVLGFEQPDGPSLFVLSLKAGGVGLNLTAANHVIHVDRWWNPAVENQATDRAFRIGQRKNVQVRKLMCAGTLEERIDQVIEEKQELAARIVGSGESWLTELSVAELRGIIALSADAVVE